MLEACSDERNVKVDILDLTKSQGFWDISAGFEDRNCQSFSRKKGLDSCDHGNRALIVFGDSALLGGIEEQGLRCDTDVP